jgi:membrane associated rhomboid family serine protease
MIGNPLLHAGPLHLAGNLLVLLSCWPALSAALGGYRAAALLTATGWASNAITAAVTHRPVIGASAAAAAALTACLTLRPDGRLLGLPIAAIALPWLAAQALFSTLGPTFAGIAWPAHLIGAALGALGAHLLRRRAASS